jgi:ATP-dependent DNA helicase DinG
MALLPPLLSHHAFVDLETTGLDPRRDEVIEVGIVFVEADQIVGRVTKLFRPTRRLPLVIQRITGLSDEQLASQSEFASYAAELTQLLRGWTVVAHNATFEQSFLAAIFEPLATPVLDSCELLHYLHPELPSHSLENLVRWTQVGTGATHRALQDAEDTFAALKAVLSGCIAQARHEDVAELVSMLGGAADAKSALVELLQRLHLWALQSRPALKLTETTPFLPAPAERARRFRPEAASVSGADLESLLGRHGALAEAMAGFVSRPEQRSMASDVLHNFATAGSLAIEAGTGTGKSLGYLAPAALWASRGGGRIGVAPHTRTLQDQLIEKELPRLHQATQGAFGYAVLKGQSNYLCRRRCLEATNVAESMGWAQRAPRAYLRAFLRRSTEGDIDRLSHWFKDRYPALPGLIAASQSTAATTLAERCPHYTRCYFHSAVSHAREADLVVVNHALALAWPERYPKLHHLIVDEAHELEDSATTAWTVELSENVLGALLNRVSALPGRLARAGHSAAGQALKVGTSEVVIDLKVLSEALTAMGEESGEELRLTPHVRASRGWLRVRDALHGLKASLLAAEQALAGVESPLTNEPALARDLAAARAELQQQATQVEELADRPAPGRCDSLAFSSSGWSFASQPVSIKARLAEAVQPLSSLTLVSASLSVGPGESWVLERLGLASGSRRMRVVRYETPFDLARQALVVLVTDAPEATSLDFIDWAGQRISGLARYLGGRVLGLFASAQRLDAVGERVRRQLEPEGIEVLRQSHGAAQRLAVRQAEDRGTVLLGTRRFWAGIDVPGPGVSCVFIDKLPLEPHARPLVEAREEALGGEPFGFVGYRLPRALLQLKQGVGRLVRSGTDCGVVVIADPGAMAYRAQLYAALDGYRVESMAWGQARVRIAQVFRSFGMSPRVTPSAPARHEWLGPLFH